MKKFILLACLIPAISFYSCSVFNFEMPESVTVKANAAYEFPLGGYSLEFAEEINVGKLQDILEDDDGESDSVFHVYDYRPDGKDADGVMTYILDYQIANIPLTVEADSDIGSISFDMEFDAPDFSGIISETLAVEGRELPVIEPGDSEFGRNLDAPIDFKITSPVFDKMSISEGFMVVKIVKSSDEDIVSEDFEMTISVALTDADGEILKRADGSEIRGESSNKDLAKEGDEIRLDLSGMEIEPYLKIIVGGSLSGGEQGKEHIYIISAGADGIKPKKITGLTMDEESLGENNKLLIQEEFSLNGMNTFLSAATIEKGSLSFSCEYPDGWSGIIIEETNFFLNGALELKRDEFKDASGDGNFILNKTASMDGKTIHPSSENEKEREYEVFTYNENNENDCSYLKFSVEDATIIFAEDGNDKITLNGSCEIESLTKLVIDISSLNDLNGEEGEIDTGLSFSSLLGDLLDNEDDENDISALMDDIKFSGIEGYLFMTYPESDGADDNQLDETFGNLKFNASIMANYTDKNEKPQEPIELIPRQILSMTQTKQTLASLADKDSIIGEKGKEFFSDENKGETYTAKITAFDELINSQPDNLVITYNLKLDDNKADKVTLSGDVLKAITDGTASVNLSVALVLPLQLKFVDNKDIPTSEPYQKKDGWITIHDVMAVAGNEIDEDLLKRDGPDDESDFEEYADKIKSVSLHYTFKNDSGLGMKVYLYDDKVFVYDDDESKNKAKTLKLTGEETKFEFTRDDINELFKAENYPFLPKIGVKIEAENPDEPDGERERGLVSLKHSASFGIEKVRFSVAVDGEVKIWDKND